MFRNNQQGWTKLASHTKQGKVSAPPWHPRRNQHRQGNCLHAARLLTTLVLLLCPATLSAQTTVHLMLGDFNSKLAVDAVGAVQQEFPEMAATIDFEIVTSRSAEAVARPPLVARKGFALVHIMDRRQVERWKPAIRNFQTHGVKVYAVGGAYGKEDRELGLIDDAEVNRYYRENGLENMTRMLVFLLSRDCGFAGEVRPPAPVPQNGIYLRAEKRTLPDFAAFRRAYPARPGRPWVGLTLYKNSVDSGETEVVDAIIDRLEDSGCNVLPVYGYPAEKAMEQFFFDDQGKARVRAVVGLSLKVGLTPQRAVPILSRLGVPVLDAITLSNQSREEWERSPLGLDLFERSAMVGLPELAGIIQPTVVAARERAVDAASGLEYLSVRPIPERVDRLVARIKAWLKLQERANRDKKVALIYYNYPPGKQNIGAAYLNVLPESLFAIVERLRQAGYNIGKAKPNKEHLFADVHGQGRNIGNWAPAEVDRLARGGKPVLIPVATYKQWFKDLPAAFRQAVIKDWGEPEEASIMTWVNPKGEKFLVIPAVRYGNLLLTPEPARGWEQDVKKLYHDVQIAPHHQYIAFHLWLKREFKADALIHLGTHGTQEWLGGKEVGFTEVDPPEILIQDLPNIYPYIVDDVGEGLQAKRRGMAVVIDYMTPPFDKAGMNREARELTGLISEYGVAKEKSAPLAEAKLTAINQLAVKTGLLTDLKLAQIRTPGEVEALDDYLKEIGETQTPFGLHTFGQSPVAKYRQSTAEAIVGIEQGLTPEERRQRTAVMEQAIAESGPRELDALVAALAGRYIPAGPGNDPIRSPDSLPTGRNFYSFDPARSPSPATYATGARLATDLVEEYRQQHGQYPDKLTYNLWATETIRHEGVMESQILALMGVRPKWDERGRVSGVEPIPREELGRPRLDVTIVPSGLYRDIFPLLMGLLDSGVSLARDQAEEDNLVRAHIEKTMAMLRAKGIAEDKARRLASVRIFTEPPGAYGTNLDKVIVASNTWDKEQQVAEVYFLRMGYLYGQGFWGEKEQQAGEDLGDTLLKTGLAGSKIAIHSRATNTIGVLDTDDFFQYLGGTAQAIRAVDGKSPEVHVTNMTNPKKPVQESLEKSMGREMRARYLNPAWIKAMMREGYAGARFVDKVVEHLWGWQVTVPEAVDAAKWQEMYETYVVDRNNLGIKEMFREARNMWAYQSLVARMLETVRKGYWQPDRDVVAKLAEEYARTTKEVGLACCDHTCNNPQLTEFTSATLLSVPGLSGLNKEFIKALEAMQQPAAQGKGTGSKEQAQAASEAKPAAEARANRAPDGSGKPVSENRKVEGYEMEESKPATGGGSAPIPWLFLLGFAVLVGLVAWGYRRGGRD